MTESTTKAAALLCQIHNYCLKHPELPRMPRDSAANADADPELWDHCDHVIIFWLEDESRRAIPGDVATQVKSSMAFCISEEFYAHVAEHHDDMLRKRWSPKKVAAVLEEYNAKHPPSAFIKDKDLPMKAWPKGPWVEGWVPPGAGSRFPSDVHTEILLAFRLVTWRRAPAKRKRAK